MLGKKNKEYHQNSRGENCTDNKYCLVGAGPPEGDTQFLENQQKWNGPEVISWMLSFSHHSLFPWNSHIIIYLEANLMGKAVFFTWI